ncbi:hypothetical protein F5144DRAFT_166348 [Chaetomium tenue]|uniref:Uncharacterized protein n=1 Tax=Chaetomium tenue TaxID=1854479 RepID=A0ACB7PBH0_9PEZI|nr:hypothetical protein F5144DRAFT_166348 [Chaetomium globosum]
MRAYVARRNPSTPVAGMRNGCLLQTPPCRATDMTACRREAHAHKAGVGHRGLSHTQTSSVCRCYDPAGELVRTTSDNDWQSRLSPTFGSKPTEGGGRQLGSVGNNTPPLPPSYKYHPSDLARLKRDYSLGQIGIGGFWRLCQAPSSLSWPSVCTWYLLRCYIDVRCRICHDLHRQSQPRNSLLGIIVPWSEVTVHGGSVNRRPPS